MSSPTPSGWAAPCHLSDGPVARGQAREMCGASRRRLAPGRSRCPSGVSAEADVALSTRLQETAYAAGRAHPGGTPHAVTVVCSRTCQGQQVRVYSWVDLLPPDPLLDPALVGRLVGAVHSLDVPARGRAGLLVHRTRSATTRWDCARDRPARCRRAFRRADGRAARRAGGPRVVARGHRDASGCATATCGPTTCCRPTDGRSVRHRLGEQRPGRPEPGAGVRGVRVRPERFRARARAAGGLPQRRWHRHAERPRRLLDAHRAARAHHRDRAPATGSSPTAGLRSAAPRRPGSARSSTTRTPATCSTRCSAAAQSVGVGDRAQLEESSPHRLEGVDAEVGHPLGLDRTLLGTGDLDRGPGRAR